MALDVQNGYEIQMNGENLTVRGVERWVIGSGNGLLGEMTQTVSVLAPPETDDNGKRGDAVVSQANVKSTPFLPLAAGETQLRPELKTPHLLGQVFLDGTTEILRLIVERPNNG